MSLRVRSLETFPVGLPFRRPYVTATGTLDRREMVVIRIRSEEGITGYGDAVPMSLRGGPGLDTVRSDLADICAPLLPDIDFGADPVGAIPTALARCRDGGAGAQALSAVDIALLDLIGKATDTPAWRLLGADRAEPVLCNGTLGADDPAAAAEVAASMCREGFTTLKVKVGSGDDLARMRAVRAAAGPEIKLRIDANGAWGAREAIARLADLAPLGIELVEQPCRRIEDLAEVRAATGMRDRRRRERGRPGGGHGCPRLRCDRRRDAEAGEGRRRPGGAEDRAPPFPPTSPARSTAPSGSRRPRTRHRPCSRGSSHPGWLTGSPPRGCSRTMSPTTRTCADP